MTEEQNRGSTQWREIEKSLIPNREDAKENTRKMKSDYATVASYVRPLAFKMQTMFLPIHHLGFAGAHAAGPGAVRWGFLSGQWSNRDLLEGRCDRLRYRLAPGHLQLLPQLPAPRPNLEAALARMEVVPIRVGRPDLSVPADPPGDGPRRGHRPACTSRASFQRLFRRLEAVGQMAFTNYIMHSVICTLFFFGYGLNYYGELDFYQIYFRRARHLGPAVDRQPAVAAVFPLRPAGMALAEPDLLEVATIPQKRAAESESGEAGPPGA